MFGKNPIIALAIHAMADFDAAGHAAQLLGADDAPTDGAGEGDVAAEAESEAPGLAETAGESAPAPVDHAAAPDADGTPATDDVASLKAELENQKKALSEERALRKKVLAENEQMRVDIQSFARLAEEVEALKKDRAATDETVQEDPEYLDDPQAYIDHGVAEARKAADDAVKTAQQANAEAGQQRLITHLQGLESAYSGQNEHYEEAKAYLRVNNAEEFMALNPDARPEDVMNVVMAGEVEVAKKLLQAGRNPIEFLYETAVRRGYTPGCMEGYGKDPVPESGNPVTEDPDREKLARIRKGQEVSETGSAGSAAAAEVPEDDFPEFSSAMGDLLEKWKPRRPHA